MEEGGEGEGEPDEKGEAMKSQQEMISSAAPLLTRSMLAQEEEEEDKEDEEEDEEDGTEEEDDDSAVGEVDAAAPIMNEEETFDGSEFVLVVADVDTVCVFGDEFIASNTQTLLRVKSNGTVPSRT